MTDNTNLPAWDEVRLGPPVYNEKAIEERLNRDVERAMRPAKNDQKVSVVDSLVSEVHQIAVEHGWWEDDRSDGECIALMHSELSESLEAMRHGLPKDPHIPEHDNMTVELADCIIRIFDYAGARNLNLSGALLAKIEYNRSREYKHGKKF